MPNNSNNNKAKQTFTHAGRNISHRPASDAIPQSDHKFAALRRDALEAKRKQNEAETKKEAERKREVGYEQSEDARRMIVDELDFLACEATVKMRDAKNTSATPRAESCLTGDADSIYPEDLSLEQRLLFVRVYEPQLANRDNVYTQEVMAQFDHENRGKDKEYVDEAGTEAGRRLTMNAYQKYKKPLTPDL